VRQMEQTDGCPKQRHFGRADEAFDASGRFDLLPTAPRLRDGWRYALCGRRIGKSSRGGNFKPSVFSSSQSLSLVRHTFGFNACSVPRSTLTDSPRIFSELISHEINDLCDTNVSRFSSATVFVVADDSLYKRHHVITVLSLKRNTRDKVRARKWIRFLWKKAKQTIKANAA